MKVLLDVDTGVDDALALLYLAAAARRGRLEVVGCGTVAGNISVVRTTRNTLKVLELAGLDVPVAQGADAPLASPLQPAHYVHGDDGLANTWLAPPHRWPSGESAVDQILRLSHDYEGELVVLTFGPLTNVALALDRDPGLAHRLRRLVVMGGAVGMGNVTATAEANVHNDPEAARIVLGCGAPITLVGLDVTHEVWLEEADLEPLARLDTDRSDLVLHFVRHLMDAYTRLGRPRRCVPHDPLAAGVCLDPGLVGTRKLHVDVELHGELTRGMTVADRRPLPDGVPAVDVALTVDASRFKADFLDALFAWAHDGQSASWDARILEVAA